MVKQLGVQKLGAALAPPDTAIQRFRKKQELVKTRGQYEAAVSGYQKESGEYYAALPTQDEMFDEAILGREEAEYQQSASKLQANIDRYGNVLEKQGFETKGLKAQKSMINTELGAGATAKGISVAQYQYGKERKEYIAELGKEDLNANIDKEGSEYEASVANFSNVLTQAGKNDIVPQLEQERQSFTAEKGRVKAFNAAYVGASFVGDFEERRDSFTNFANINQENISLSERNFNMYEKMFNKYSDPMVYASSFENDPNYTVTTSGTQKIISMKPQKYEQSYSKNKGGSANISYGFFTPHELVLEDNKLISETRRGTYTKRTSKDRKSVV